MSFTTADELEDLTVLVNALGRKNFLSTLANFLENVVHSDHLTLNVIDSRFTPYLAAGISRNRSDITSHLSDLYRKSHYYYYDPSLQNLDDRTKEISAPLIVQTHAREIYNAQYRQEIYEKHGLLDRLSILDHSPQGWFTLNLYRDTSGVFYNRAEIRKLQSASELLFSFVKKHLELRPPAEWKSTTIPPIGQLEALVESLDASLSRREIQACARILRGQTREGVALDLGVKTPTIATLLQRAYSKLNISSLNQLFALCLGKSGATPL